MNDESALEGNEKLGATAGVAGGEASQANGLNAAEAMFEAGVRTECVIWLPGIHAQPPIAFSDEFVESLPDDPEDPLYKTLPELAVFAAGEDYPDAEDVACAMVRRVGFLVQAARPVHTWHSDLLGASYSWGHYSTAWLYAADPEAIAGVCLAWAAAQEASEKAKILPADGVPAARPLADASQVPGSIE